MANHFKRMVADVVEIGHGFSDKAIIYHGNVPNSAVRRCNDDEPAGTGKSQSLIDGVAITLVQHTLLWLVPSQAALVDNNARSKCLWNGSPVAYSRNIQPQTVTTSLNTHIHETRAALTLL